MFFLTLGIFPHKIRFLFRKNPVGLPRERLSSPHGLDMKIAAEACPTGRFHTWVVDIASFQTVRKMNEGALEDDFLFQSDDF